MLQIGDLAPDFCLFNQKEEKVCLKDFENKSLILYFYPKNNTSGCTQEALEFAELNKELSQLNIKIIGINADLVKSHAQFSAKLNLPFDLLSDKEKNVLKAYHAWQLKKLYGKEYMGIVRTTYIISPQKTILNIWNKVRAKGHAKKVLDWAIENKALLL